MNGVKHRAIEALAHPSDHCQRTYIVTASTKGSVDASCRWIRQHNLVTRSAASSMSCRSV
jgi:hypothetical protein